MRTSSTWFDRNSNNSVPCIMILVWNSSGLCGAVLQGIPWILFAMFCSSLVSFRHMCPALILQILKPRSSYFLSCCCLFAGKSSANYESSIRSWYSMSVCVFIRYLTDTYSTPSQNILTLLHCSDWGFLLSAPFEIKGENQVISKALEKQNKNKRFFCVGGDVGIWDCVRATDDSLCL